MTDIALNLLRLQPAAQIQPRHKIARIGGKRRYRLLQWAFRNSL